MIPPLLPESEEELKSLLMKVKEESEKAGLKLNTHKMKIMASSSIASWQIGEETMETVTDLILGDSNITANGDCSYEIQRHLLLGRKVRFYSSFLLGRKPRQRIKKQRCYLANKLKIMVFPVVMYGCESWTIKKAECQRN